MKHILSTAILCGALVACQMPVPTNTQSDPAIVAKINYVCAYSGLFKFADTTAASVVPVPGVAMAASLVNSGVDQVCLHPDTVATDVAVVQSLIAQFKAAGKM